MICACYQFYGDKCVEKFNGMFAFVIYDEKNNILFGARDRFGQKPFYYTLNNGFFEFSSQLSPIVINSKYLVDIKSLNQFLVWNYIPEPKSIYKGHKELEAGHKFTYDLEKMLLKRKILGFRLFNN